MKLFLLSFIVPHASVQPFGEALEENRNLISFCSTWLKRRHRLFLINNGMVKPLGGSKQYSSWGPQNVDCAIGTSATSTKQSSDADLRLVQLSSGISTAFFSAVSLCILWYVYEESRWLWSWIWGTAAEEAFKGSCSWPLDVFKVGWESHYGTFFGSLYGTNKKMLVHLKPNAVALRLQIFEQTGIKMWKS